ncbi:MAG: flagellar motor protein [Bryobacteraceae bacterium]
MKLQRKADLATIGGLVVALGGIVGGLILEGGSIKDIGQFTAGLIVLGGTLGAVMVNTPMDLLKRAGKRLIAVFLYTPVAPSQIAEEIIGFATKARKNGIVSLEHDAAEIQDPFLRKALNLAIDGADLQELRNMMELEISLEEHHVEAEAKVFESAGGYSPTIGIIGAVMGLIQVMKHLANIDEVGKGIAVAFVATVYGVAVSNLFFLPVASKIKARAHEETERRELILEGVVGIVEGLNPKLIRTKLEIYARHQPIAAGSKSVEAPSEKAA